MVVTECNIMTNEKHLDSERNGQSVQKCSKGGRHNGNGRIDQPIQIAGYKTEV